MCNSELAGSNLSCLAPAASAANASVAVITFMFGDTIMPPPAVLNDGPSELEGGPSPPLRDQECIGDVLQW
jgi:hypothetical protein